ncbi:MAG: helix-turn-helix domain-containing protein [Ruminococcus flavefaciens]|nr:helix-turn-helix domain-containing protein [Ruminococcus flavefaciens]
MAKKRKTQCERILEYMERFGSITTFDAFVELNCTRLSSRINDLRNAGYKILGQFETIRNKFGEAVSYKRYSLAESEKDGVEIDNQRS